MKIDITILISVMSVAAAVIFGIIAATRGQRNDTQQETSQLTTVIVKLENIGGDICEIKGDMKAVKDVLNAHGERLAKCEEQIKNLNNEVFKKNNKE